jgi:hypothetical protein
MTALLRTGDVVGLTGKVRHDCRPDEDSGRVFVDVEGHHSALWVKLEHVTLIAPRIDVGERVRWTNGAEAKVIASDADKLWVKADDGTYLIWPAKEVTVLVQKAADPDPVEPPPAPLDGKVGSDEEA